MVSVKFILHWYSLNKRSLPWRRDGISPYEVWVSEIMLQQTQVSRGIQYYERFLKKFPNVQKLSLAEWEDFLPYYEGLGYYARGRNMLKTAKIIMDEFGGEFPRDKAMLMKLPGIGEYTACAILSFAWNEPFVAFDTNFKKIFKTREIAEREFQKSGVKSSVFNSAVMDYASANRPLTVIPPACGRKVGRGRGSGSTKAQTGRGAVDSGSRAGMTICSSGYLILHEDHKKYFSEGAKEYKPFLLPKNVRSRSEIKDHFLRKYGLRVSVRPPNKEGVVNAQILSGRHAFAIFDKKSYDEWRKGD